MALTEIPTTNNGVKVTREPRTYEQHGTHSFFRDLIRVAVDRDPDAMGRLARHEHEAAVERRTANRQPDGVEFRTNPNVTLGLGGEFSPPAWMVELFAGPGRPGRVLADLIDQCGNLFVLPRGVESVHIPRLSTGTSTGVQADGAAATEVDGVTAEAKSAVVTIAGIEDVSQQLYDLAPAPGSDVIWARDLDHAYDKNLATQLLTGTGGAANTPGAQLNGLTNISGIPTGNKVDGTSSTTIATIWPLLGRVAANIANTRFLPPEAWLLAGRRFFWFASSIDNNNRPLALPAQWWENEGPPPAGGVSPFGLVGLPAYADGAIPAGTSADTAYAVRPSDMYVWESEPRFLATAESIGGSLQVRLSLHRYVAAILDRYPSGTGWLNNLAQPTNF